MNIDRELKEVDQTLENSIAAVQAQYEDLISEKLCSSTLALDLTLSPVIFRNFIDWPILRITTQPATLPNRKFDRLSLDDDKRTSEFSVSVNIDSFKR